MKEYREVVIYPQVQKMHIRHIEDYATFHSCQKDFTPVCEHYYDSEQFVSNKELKIKLEAIKKTYRASVKYVWLLPNVYNDADFVFRMGITNRRVDSFGFDTQKEITKMNSVSKLITKPVNRDVYTALIEYDRKEYYIKTNFFDVKHKSILEILDELDVKSSQKKKHNKD